MADDNQPAAPAAEAPAPASTAESAAPQSEVPAAGAAPASSSAPAAAAAVAAPSSAPAEAAAPPAAPPTGAPEGPTGLPNDPIPVSSSSSASEADALPAEPVQQPSQAPEQALVQAQPPAPTAEAPAEPSALPSAPAAAAPATGSDAPPPAAAAPGVSSGPTQAPAPAAAEAAAAGGACDDATAALSANGADAEMASGSADDGGSDASSSSSAPLAAARSPPRSVPGPSASAAKPAFSNLKQSAPGAGGASAGGKARVRFLDDDADMPSITLAGEGPKAQNKQAAKTRDGTPPPAQAQAQQPAETGAASQAVATIESQPLPSALPPPPAAQTLPERIASLRARIAADRRDGEAWLHLVEAVQSQAAGAADAADAERVLNETKEAYEGLLEVFPYAAKQWIAYIDVLLANSDFSGVEALFARCLRGISSVSVDLWRSYLSYTRRVNPIPPFDPAAPAAAAAGQKDAYERARKVVQDAYEFALGTIGSEREAGAIWHEYIAFLKERKTQGGPAAAQVGSQAQWEEGQKMDAIRKAYQRAVTQPTNEIEKLWREYDAFENSVNRATAKRFLAERSAAYMTARGAQREMASLVDGLSKPLIPRVPAWTLHRNSAGSARGNALAQRLQRERGAAEGWKRYLAWEEGNPLALEDKAALQARKTAAYRRAVASLQFYPEIWYLAYANTEKAAAGASAAAGAEAVAWLEKGLESCPTSFLLSFALIDHHERSKAATAAATCGPIFEKLIEQTGERVTARRAEAEAQLARIDAESAAAEQAVKARKAAQGAGEELEGEEKELLRKQDEGRQARKRAIEAQLELDLEQLREEVSLVYIKQMQFLRRTDGIRPARLCFGKARKSPHCTWHVYEASAMLEYHCSKDTRVATNVFELALKTFPTSEALVLRYLDFLLSINDDNNARALFERAVAALPPEKARPVWERWAEYEYNFGDLTAILRLETRMEEAFPDEPKIDRLTERSSYADIEVISAHDLGRTSAEELQAVNGSAADAAPAAVADADDAHDGPAGKKRRLPGAPDADAAARGVSPVPAGAPTGPKRHKANGAAPVDPQAQLAMGVPAGLRYFLSVLPMKSNFDGPLMPADLMMEAILGANLPPVGLQGPGPGMAVPAMPPMMAPAAQQMMAMQQPQLPAGAKATRRGKRSGRQVAMHG